VNCDCPEPVGGVAGRVLAAGLQAPGSRIAFQPIDYRARVFGLRLRLLQLGGRLQPIAQEELETRFQLCT
jgi:hypothetical protein